MRSISLPKLAGATALLAATLCTSSAALADPPWARGGFRHGPPPWAPAHGWRRHHGYGGFEVRPYRTMRYEERRYRRFNDWD